MEITKGENANLAGMEPPEGKVRNFDDPETIVDHIVGMVADDGSITDVARELAIDYVRTRLLYAGLERLAYIVEEKLTDPAGMEPRCPKCGSEDFREWVEDQIFKFFCNSCHHHTAEVIRLTKLAQFFRSPAPTPPLDVEARELEEAWSMLVERGVRIYTLSTALIDRDAYARTERAITQLLSLLRRHIASPAQPENLPAPPQSGKEGQS